MLPVTLAGGLVGAVLLLATPARLFDVVIPFLLLLATLTFAFGARAGLALRRVVPVGPGAVLPTQFLVSIYGGYFGGAVGLMMMAAWSLLTANADLKAMAPARVLLVSAANGAAVLWFIGAGAVRWPETLAMLGASILGGYLGCAADAPAAVRRGARLRGGADRNGDHRVFCACDVKICTRAGIRRPDTCGSYRSDRHRVAQSLDGGFQCGF